MGKNNRKNLLHTNKYQRKIIVVPLFSTLILCTFLSIIILFVQHDILKAVLNTQNMHVLQLVNRWAILFVIYIWFFFILVIVGAFTVSSNLVGAFTRIIKELDLVLSGKKKSPIKARKDDELANLLLKRINCLIEKTLKPLQTET